MKTWPGVPDEERQQLEGFRLQRHVLPVAEEAVAREVDLDAPDVDERRACAYGGSLVGIAGGSRGCARSAHAG